jgi:hypothetical protein
MPLLASQQLARTRAAFCRASFPDGVLAVSAVRACAFGRFGLGFLSHPKKAVSGSATTKLAVIRQ